jgi:hypothetical protein
MCCHHMKPFSPSKTRRTWWMSFGLTIYFEYASFDYYLIQYMFPLLHHETIVPVNSH